MARKNWEGMERDFCEGIIGDDGQIRFPSLVELTEEYNCTYSAISKQSSLKKWKEKRKAFIKKLETKRQEKKIDSNVQSRAEFHAKILEISKAFLSHCVQHLVEHQNNNKLIPAVDLNRLSQVVMRMTSTGLQALGDAPASQTPLIDFANELIAKMSKQ